MNPENTVGVLTMAGKKGCVRRHFLIWTRFAAASIYQPCAVARSISVLCPLVSTMQDLGKILAVLHSREKIRIDGESNFIAALKTATVREIHVFLGSVGAYNSDASRSSRSSIAQKSG